METLELAEGLRVVGTGVDRLDSQLAKTVLELELDAMEASGETQLVEFLTDVKPSPPLNRPGFLGGSDVPRIPWIWLV